MSDEKTIRDHAFDFARNCGINLDRWHVMEAHIGPDEVTFTLMRKVNPAPGSPDVWTVSKSMRPGIVESEDQ